MTTDAQTAGEQPNTAAPDAAAPSGAPQDTQAPQAADATAGAPQTDEGNAAAGAKAADDAANTGEEIVYEFTLPEGVSLDEEIGTELKALAKEKNLTKDEAQKFLDLGVKQRMKEAEAFQRQRETWRETVRTDAEIGGANLEANLALAKKAVDAFGTPEAKELLLSSWVGEHPAIIKTFVAIGKAISEDGMVISSGSAASAAPADARRLYSRTEMNP